MEGTEHRSPVQTASGSITRPSKYNTGSPVIRHNQVDTLEANTDSPLIQGLVEHLLQVQREMEPGQKSAPTALVFDGEPLQLSHKGSYGYAFYLRNDSCQIMLQKGGVLGDRNITAYIRLLSGYLLRTELGAAIKALQELACQILGAEGAATLRICRVDLARDFEWSSDLTRESYSEFAGCLVSRGRPSPHEEHGHRLSGITIGKHDALQVQLYNKTLQAKLKGNLAIMDAHRKAGWSGDGAVWRLECRFFAPGLRQFRTEKGEHVELENLPALLGSLWKYATRSWCRHVEPMQGDTNRSRWPLSAFWRVLAADFEASESIEKLSRIREREWKVRKLESQQVGIAKTIAALLGGEASPLLINWRYQRAIEDDQRRRGMSFAQSVRLRRSEMMIVAA